MPWVPESDPMVTVTESGNFSVTVQYYELVGGGVDPISGIETPATPVYYKVKVTPQIEDPATIAITNNDTTDVTISGYYGPCFNDKLKVMLTYDIENPENTSQPIYRDYDTLTAEPVGVGSWVKFAENTDNFEIVEFIPDMTRTRDISYTCVAYDTNPNSPISTVVKINRVQDLSWDSGRDALANAVNSLKRRKS